MFRKLHTEAIKRAAAFTAVLLLLFFTSAVLAEEGRCHILLLMTDGDPSVCFGEDLYPAAFTETRLQEAAAAFFGACMTENTTRGALIKGSETPEILCGVTGSKAELVASAEKLTAEKGKRDFCAALTAAEDLLKTSGSERGTVTMVFSLPPDIGNTAAAGLYSAASFPFASPDGAWYFPYMNAVRGLCESLSSGFTLNAVLLLPSVPVSGNAGVFFSGMQSFASDITNGTVTVALGDEQLQNALVSAGMSASFTGKAERIVPAAYSSAYPWAYICGGGALLILIAVIILIIGKGRRRKKRPRPYDKPAKRSSSRASGSQIPPDDQDW